jgi:transcriptional antiterminator RfaH
MSNWYVLQTKSQKEALINQQLEMHHIPVFFPQLTVKPVNPRARTLRPLFPGYVFVYADLAKVGLSLFQHLPFAIGLVSFGGVPAAVESGLLHEIEQRLDQINAAGGEPFLKLQRGDRVRIEHGAFAGLEAIFDGRLRDSDRVRVLIELIGQRQVVLELNVGYLGERLT